MANAVKDENGINTITGVLNSSGASIVRVKIDPTTHGLYTGDASTGSNNGPTNALRDDNFVTTFLAVSSSDGVTVVPLYCDSSGNLLVDSN